MDVEEVLIFAGAAGLAALVIRAAMQNNSNFGADNVDNTQAPGDTGIPDFVQADESTSDASSPSASGPSLISQWADAVFHFEGGNPSDRNVRNNNPGNLKHAPDEFTGTPTQFDSDGFVIFPSMDAGFAALNNQLTQFVKNYPNFSLTQIMARYLGQSGLNPQVTNQGNPFNYANSIASSLGVSADQTLQQIFGGN